LKNDFGREFLEEEVEVAYSQDYRMASGVFLDFRKNDLVVEEQEDEKEYFLLMFLDVC